MTREWNRALQHGAVRSGRVQPLSGEWEPLPSAQGGAVLQFRAFLSRAWPRTVAVVLVAAVGATLACALLPSAAAASSARLYIAAGEKPVPAGAELQGVSSGPVMKSGEGQTVFECKGDEGDKKGAGAELNLKLSSNEAAKLVAMSVPPAPAYPGCSSTLGKADVQAVGLPWTVDISSGGGALTGDKKVGWTVEYPKVAGDPSCTYEASRVPLTGTIGGSRYRSDKLALTAAGTFVLNAKASSAKCLDASLTWHLGEWSYASHEAVIYEEPDSPRIELVTGLGEPGLPKKTLLSPFLGISADGFYCAFSGHTGASAEIASDGMAVDRLSMDLGYPECISTTSQTSIDTKKLELSDHEEAIIALAEPVRVAETEYSSDNPEPPCYYEGTGSQITSAYTLNAVIEIPIVVPVDLLPAKSSPTCQPTEDLHGSLTLSYVAPDSSEEHLVYAEELG
jgi:hypothetical protein